MSRENILADLHHYSIQIQELTLSTACLSQYRGSYSGLEATIQVLHYQEGLDYTWLQQECEVMKNLSHPNILKLLSCFWLQKEGRHYYVMATEWCAKDLERDIWQRTENRYPYSEAELLSICCQMIDALAYMQLQNLAHRNIKPANIYLSTMKIIKLGDFNSSSRISQACDSLVGTPYYFSPILKETLLGQSFAQHNLFKSDVYSLGVTFLETANLGTSEIFKRQVTDEEVMQEIEGIGYSDEVKELLRAMLGFEESSRLDFVQLWEWVCTRSWGIPLPRETPSVLELPDEGVNMQAALNPQGSTWPQSEWSGGSVELPLPYIEQAPGYMPDFQSQDPSLSPTLAQNPANPPAPPPLTQPRAIYSFTLPVFRMPIVPSDTSEIILDNPDPQSCLECGAAVDTTNLAGSAVQLFCRPESDMYCSGYCFVKSIRARQPPTCPACSQGLDPVQIGEFQGMSKMYPVCQGCSGLINATGAQRTALPHFTCGLAEHVCCTLQCMERFDGRCPVCVGAVQEQLLPTPPVVNGGFCRRLLACVCGRRHGVEE